ncbi:MAG: hypothetical protein WAO28_02870 [Candidatus Microsaccharimonas sp.]
MSERHMSKAELAARTAAAGLVLSFGAYGLAGCAPIVNAGPSPDPKPTSETATPNPNNEQSEFEQQVESLRIPEGLSDEELAKVMLERQEAWANYGKRDTLPRESAEANLSWDDFLLQEATKNAEVFTAALLPANWRDDENLRTYVDSSIAYNFLVLKAYVSTAWNGDEVPENVEGFKTDFIFDNVTLVEAPEGQRGLVIDFTEDYNDEMNTVEPIETPWHRIDTTFETVDGHEQVTSAFISVRYSQ